MSQLVVIAAPKSSYAVAVAHGESQFQREDWLGLTFVWHNASLNYLL